MRHLTKQEGCGSAARTNWPHRKTFLIWKPVSTFHK